ncbi:hypothetical protein [Castellaniella sp.]
MSKKADRWDNSPVESFWGLRKTAARSVANASGRADARQSLDDLFQW